MNRSSFAMASFALLTACFGTDSSAQEPATTTDAGTMTREGTDKAFQARPYAPYAGRNFPTHPLFGDTHLHTALSMDAGAAGARLDPREAYRFASGEEVVSSTGQPVRLSRPLDFLVVTDHSDNMGFFTDFLAGKPEILKNPEARGWYDLMQSGKGAKLPSRLSRPSHKADFRRRSCTSRATPHTAPRGRVSSTRPKKPMSRVVSLP